MISGHPPLFLFRPAPGLVFGRQYNKDMRGRDA